MSIIERKNNDFSLTEKLNDFIRNYEWQQGFQHVIENDLPRDSNGNIKFNECPEYSTLWLTLSAAFEDTASDIYERTSNIVASNVDVETCSVNALKSLAQEIGMDTMRLFDVDYPLEIKELIDIFSMPKSTIITQNRVLTDNSYNDIINTTYSVTSGSLNGYLTGFVTVSGTQWISGINSEDEIAYSADSLWTESEYNNIISSKTSGYIMVNDDNYINYIDNCISGTLEKYVNLDRVIDDMYASIYTRFEKSVRTILDTPDDDETIVALKEQYGIPLSFFVNEETDKIIRGEATLVSYNTNEQDIILQEIERRKEFSKYGNQPTKFRRFKYEKERKVREYIRFIENLNILAKSSISQQENDQYDLISGESYGFFGYYDDTNPLSGQPLSGDMLANAVYSIRNICLNISYQRENVRSVVQKHQMLGTERVLRTLISEYIYREFAKPELWRLHSFDEVASGDLSINDITIRNLLNISGDLFNSISVIEYVDPTKYLSLSAQNNEYASDAEINERFWENSNNIISSEHTSGEVLSFYNNLGLDNMQPSEINTFINHIYDMGAISATQNISGEWNRNVNPSLSAYVSGSLSGMYDKYFGIYQYDSSIKGNLPWANYSNVIHPTVAHIPWLYGLQSIIDTSLALENIFSYTPQTFDELSGNLQYRYDENGNIIDMWRKDNDMFNSYRDNYEFSYNLDSNGATNDRIDYNGPFSFPALSAYIDDTATFIDNFDYWYSHLVLESVEETKIKWQLANYETRIRSLANKKIYQFGVDKYGNEYTLYKDTNDFDIQGELWMKYKDHPISFPVTDTNAEQNYQLDTESYLLKSDVFTEYSEKCYDFGFITLEATNIMWMYIGDEPNGNKSGTLLMTTINQNISSNKNKYIGKRLLGNLVEYDINNSNETHIGVYKTDGNNGATMMYVTLQSFLPHPTETNQFIANFRFRAYDNENGLKLRNKTAIALYGKFEATDGHNQWKLSKFDDVLTIAYESELLDIPNGTPSAIWLGSDGSGNFDTRYNTYKHGYHNGIATINFAIIRETTFPQTYDVDNFIGFNDVTYQTIQAWDGWGGGEIYGNYIETSPVHTYTINSDGYVQTQFVGASDPTTSGRFNVGPVSFLCYNDIDEHLGLWAGNILVSWADAEFSYDSTREEQLFPSGWLYAQLSDAQLSAYTRWNDTGIAFHKFTDAGQSWNFGTIDDENTFYDVTVTYNGVGCQNMRFDFSAGDNSTLKTAKFEGTYWIRASHYCDCLSTYVSGLTLNIIDPLAMDDWIIGENVHLVRESDRGGSVIIHNVEASRTETYANASIIAKSGTELTVNSVSGTLPFTTGEKLTIYQGLL